MRNFRRFKITPFVCLWVLALTTFCKKNDDLTLTDGGLQAVNTEEVKKGPAKKITIPGHQVFTLAAVDGINVKENVVDGNLATRWSGQGDPQEIILDLGERHTIDFIKIAFHTGGNATRVSKFDIAIAKDSTKKWETVIADTQSTPNNTALQIFDFQNIKGKYVKITGHGNSQNLWNSYTEIEVWGWPQKKVKPGTDTGIIDVIGDWETGDFSQWDSGIMAKSIADQFAIVTSPVRQGNYAAKFTVRPGDQYCKPAGGCTSGERAEAIRWNYKRETIDDEYYYGWSTLFPADWTEPARWGIFMQWHAHTSISPPIAFNARANSVKVDFSSGNIQNWWPAEYEQSHTILTDLNKGKWNDFIVRIKFRPDATGICEVWHRLEGQAEFTKLLSLQNIPTLQWTTRPDQIDTNYGLPFVKEGVNGYTTGCYVQHGLYRAADAANTNTLYQDNWSRGTSYAAIRATFN